MMTGITHDPEKRFKIAEKILERALKLGIKEEDVVIDPLAMAVSADPNGLPGHPGNHQTGPRPARIKHHPGGQ